VSVEPALQMTYTDDHLSIHRTDLADVAGADSSATDRRGGAPWSATDSSDLGMGTSAVDTYL
jgi:hypothetical protein